MQKLIEKKLAVIAKFAGIFLYSPMRASLAMRSSSPSTSLKTRSVVLVHPLFAAAMKTLVSSKNLVFLSCNPVALFLDIPLKFIEVYFLGLLYYSFQYG
jgi:hypothetical protein